MSNCNCGNRDQTHQDVLTTLKIAARNGSTPDSIMGVALFAVPRPDKGFLAIEKVVVHSLTYPDTIARGTNCIAFKWLTYDYLQEKLGLTDRTAITDTLANDCSGSCSDERNCEDGCLCIHSQCT
jgi:hypothetical protein